MYCSKIKAACIKQVSRNIFILNWLVGISKLQKYSRCKSTLTQEEIAFWLNV